MSVSFEAPTPAILAPLGRVGTLGMLIIDHFEVHDHAGKAVPADEPILGGGGIYATVGARHFLPPSHVGFIADVGPDLPPAFRKQLEGLGNMVWFREREVTTRALNVYSGTKIGEGTQSFKYLTPRKNISPQDYFDPLCPVGGVSWFHVVCDIHRAEAILDQIDALREQGWAGKLAWEPLVRPTEDGINLHVYARLAARFDVFSPNHVELQTIVGSMGDVEADARAWSGQCQTPIVVRAGERGAYASAPGGGWSGWVPAFWRPGEEEHIVDVTGGGNAFMGGMIAGLMLTNDLRAACIYGSTAASFAIEQRGIPRLSTEPNERWNGSDAWERLKEMAKRMDA